MSVKPIQRGRIIEEAESIVETNNTVELNEKKVDEIVEKKGAVEIVLLKDEEITVIQQEIQGIQNIEGIRNLAPEVRQEAKEILNNVEENDNSAEAEKSKIEEKKHLEKMKQEQQKRVQLERARREAKQREVAEQRARDEARQAAQSEGKKVPAGKGEKGIPMIPNL